MLQRFDIYASVDAEKPICEFLCEDPEEAIARARKDEWWKLALTSTAYAERREDA